MAGWGITALKVFKLQFLIDRKIAKMLRDFRRQKQFETQPVRALYKEFASTQRGDFYCVWSFWGTRKNLEKAT